jgi:hypothetical protein
MRGLIIVFIATAAIFNTISSAEEKSAQSAGANQTVAPSPAPAGRTSGMESFRNWFHNPTPWLSMEADLKWEWLNGWNLDTLKDDSTGRVSNWNFTLNRFRWGTKTKISDDIEFNHRWVWEFRTWDGPDTYDKNVDFDEIVWDKFNLTVRNLGDMPLTMVVGRQDIILGTGWLVLEGTNIDEGRTIFFDALRFTYEMLNRDTTLDLIFIDQSADSSAWLRPFSDGHKYINWHDERGAIIYVTDKSRPNLQLEGYFIYKDENPVNASNVNAEIYTLGGALSGPIGLSEHWKYRAEGAVQAGNKNGESLRAFGTLDTIEYHFNDAKKNVLHASLEYLSGDDPGSGRNEAFDPLWGQWPQWSVINSYAYWYETSPSETTNLLRIGLGHSFWLTEKIQMCTDYHLLWANENTRGGSSAANGLTWSNDGKFRGYLITEQLKYNLTKQLKGYFLFEYFIPGNYYAGSSRDPAYVSKINLEYTF